MSLPYRLHLLGGLYLTKQGTIVENPATTRKPLALLAILAVLGDVGVSRDRVAGYLWGEESDPKSRSLLKQLLYVIRKSIGHPGLVSGGSTLRLNSAVCSSDLADLRQALEDRRVGDVLALCRGPLLDGVYLDDNPVFQRWVDVEQGRLANRVQAVIRKEAARLESLGRFPEAVELWSALVEQEPLSDINELGLVKALVAAGDRAAAKRHAKAYAELVWRELETEPSPEILLSVNGSPVVHPLGAHQPPV